MSGSDSAEGRVRLVSLDADLGAEVQAALLRFRPTVFKLLRYSENLSVEWVEGPTAPELLGGLSHLRDLLTVHVPDLHFVARRRYSHRSLCAALEFVVSQGGFPPELVDAGLAAREAAAARQEDPYVALFQRNEWASPDLTAFALPMTSRMLSALGMVDLTDAPADVLRPGVPGVAARVETLAVLSSDDGISRPSDLVLWAASRGYEVSDELAASPLPRPTSL